MQFVKTWHMLCIVSTITGFGVLFLLTKTIVLVFYKPVQVIDLEHQEDGMTVCVASKCIHHKAPLHMKVYI